ncbi:MAG: nitroreductase family protein [Bdellovibrionota bacterium]
MHDLKNPQFIQAALAFQNGNRGFGHGVTRLLLVTSDSRAFFSIRERRQGWIDGGMFSMSLVYALHSLGLVTCCLNLCVDRLVEKDLKDCLDLQEYEKPIMMIAVGHPVEKYRVTASVRKPNAEILIRHS